MSSKMPPFSVTDSLMRLTFFMGGSVNNEQGICRSDIVRITNRNEMLGVNGSKKTGKLKRFPSYENCVRGLKVGFEQPIELRETTFRTTK